MCAATTTVPLRAPGRFERYNIARNAVGFYTSVGSTARYELPESLRTHSLEAIIFSCLRELINRHPVLGISIANEVTLSPSWVRLPTIDLTKIVTFMEQKNGEPDLASIIEDVHQDSYTDLPNLPLWRVIIVHSQSTPTAIDVGFFRHHAIGDGKSGFAFHTDLLELLNDFKLTTDEIDPIVKAPQLPLLPSIEEAHSLPVSLLFSLRRLIDSAWPWRDKLLWTGPPIYAEPNTTHLRFLEISGGLMNIILKRCREEKVTFTSLFAILVARVVAINYPDYERFSSNVAMSFRRFTKTSDRNMVNYVSVFVFQYSTKPKSGYLLCKGDFSWDIVRECNQKTIQATSSSKNHAVGLLKFLNDYAGWFKKKVGQPRENSLEISNVGVVDGGDGPCKITRMHFTQSSNVISSPLVFSLASVKGGPLSIVLTWQEGIIEPGKADKIMKEIETELNLVAQHKREDRQNS